MLQEHICGDELLDVHDSLGAYYVSSDGIEWLLAQLLVAVREGLMETTVEIDLESDACTQVCKARFLHKLCKVLGCTAA